MEAEIGSPPEDTTVPTSTEQPNEYANPVAPPEPVPRQNVPSSQPEPNTTPPSRTSSPHLQPKSSVNSPTPVAPLRTKKRVVAPLKSSEVRWFYRRNDQEKWIAFNGRDSIMLEIKHRTIPGHPTLDQYGGDLRDEFELEKRKMVVVLEGFYALSEDRRKIEAIYWKDDSCEVRRGTWFTADWQPMESSTADLIEAHHLKNFKDQPIPEGLTMFSSKETSNKPQLTELHLDSMEIRWHSVIDVVLTPKRGAFLRYISWSKSQALRRGFEKEAEWSDSPPEITHLVLVVHGIGQKGYENLIAQNSQQVQEGVLHYLNKSFNDENTRPMFLPVEWRSALVLDNGITDQITLPKMSSMRTALNSTAMDIMYYQSPLYRQEIVAGVAKQMNKVYSLFKENNPSFEGPVSIFAHSLGSVIAYDILINWSPLLLYDKCVTEAINTHLSKCEDASSTSSMKAFQAAREDLHERLDGGIKELLVNSNEQLQFKVKYFFAVGSPLGVFLVMRGGTFADLQPHRLNVERVFNIFHPYDPVAYRLEPIFAAEWKNIRPIKLFAFNDLRGKKDYRELPLEVYKTYLKKLKNISKKSADDKNSLKNEIRSGDDEFDEEDEVDSDDGRSGNSAGSASPLGEAEKIPKKSWFPFSNKKQPIASPEPAVEQAKEAECEIPIADQLLSSKSRPTNRIDFQLQPAITEKSYWSVLKSHFSYWTNQDLAVFIANILYTESAENSEMRKVSEEQKPDSHESALDV